MTYFKIYPGRGVNACEKVDLGSSSVVLMSQLQEVAIPTRTCDSFRGAFVAAAFDQEEAIWTTGRASRICWLRKKISYNAQISPEEIK